MPPTSSACPISTKEAILNSLPVLYRPRRLFLNCLPVQYKPWRPFSAHAFQFFGHVFASSLQSFSSYFTGSSSAALIRSWTSCSPASPWYVEPLAPRTSKPVTPLRPINQSFHIFFQPVGLLLSSGSSSVASAPPQSLVTRHHGNALGSRTVGVIWSFHHFGSVSTSTSSAFYRYILYFN